MDLGRTNEIYYNSSKEHLKISKIEKFSSEMSKIRKV